MKVKTRDPQSTTTLDPWGDISWAGSTYTDSSTDKSSVGNIEKPDDTKQDQSGDNVHSKIPHDIRGASLEIEGEGIYSVVFLWNADLSPSIQLELTQTSSGLNNTIYPVNSLFLSPNSTTQHEYPEEAIKEFTSLFDVGEYEYHEDVAESEFARELLILIEKYDKSGMEILSNIIIGEQVVINIASDALSWIGHIRHPSSNLLRRRFLERCLISCRSAIVRYGAVLGLSYMDDPRSIPTVRRAIDNANVPSLKQDIQQLLTQLEATQREND